MKIIEQVKEWHLKFGAPVATAPVIPPMHRAEMRQRILQEEVDELQRAWMKLDTVEVADAIADIIYIVVGTAHEFGIADKLVEVLDEVHSSNMSKLGADGKPVLRPDGKILKGPNYRKPNLFKILNPHHL